MKIQGAKKIHYDSGPNMTPLVDIVMVILIFLMLAGNFSASEKYLVSDVPIDPGGTTQEQLSNTPLPKKLQIDLSQDQRDFYAVKVGSFTARSIKDPDATYNALHNALVAMRLGFQQTGAKPEEVQVMIYADALVSLQDLLTVYQAALEAGFSNVGFGVAHTR
jgi:biopolymer transport protein ExbD